MVDDKYHFELLSREVFEHVIGPEAAVKRWPAIKKAFCSFDVDDEGCENGQTAA